MSTVSKPLPGMPSDGKWEEQETREALEKFGRDKNFTYHRYPDTRSGSRGKVVHAIAAQPSDFLVAYQSQKITRNDRAVFDGVSLVTQGLFHIETKATTKNRLTHKTLRQYGMLKKWWWAGVTPLVLVHRLDSDDWVVLQAYRLFPGQDPFTYNDDAAPKSFDFDGLFPYPSAEAALRDALNFKEKA